ncbi:glutathione S-transferase family protein [Ruegeria sp. 2205SS24-7]|uniref:glutathione S-transferase family protein n=1 Tax=Ruegeria discodermiae TaxID=3064389 RepID=UPI0027423008|nr:glutathione S-transferase family protein [Ruegeria sp. 2205SS24-7]MDP5216793.1 glutathione S-transferase family protein [Ruegeria sp. 2205SS24-7]
MLTIWGRKTSSNVQALMWCVGELDLPYQRHDVGHRFGGLDTEAFAALNPNRTIPVLQDGEAAPIWETGAILRYLAARYGDDAFWPADPVQRAEIDKWAEWAKLNIAMGFTVPIFWHVVRTAPDQRDAKAIRHAIESLEQNLIIAEAQLAAQPFLAGQTFSLADIQLGHILFRYYDIDIDRRALPALSAYYDRMTQRPAYQEHVMISYEELRVV